MKDFWKEFFKRGAFVSCLGPIIVAIIYACHGASGGAANLRPLDVSIAIISSAAMAFVAAGITAVYTVERLPLVWAIFLHAAVLYADYLSAYLINGWLTQSLQAITIFTLSFLGGYAIIWLCIYFITRKKTQNLNRKLQSL